MYVGETTKQKAEEGEKGNGKKGGRWEGEGID